MRMALALLLACVCTVLGHAQAPSKNTPRTPTPEERVLALLDVLRNHPQDDRRAAAAEALAEFDALQHFEIVSGLTTSLSSDSSPTVRRAAARALGDLRPRTHEALDALSQAVDHDDSWRVRQSARWARMGYRVDEPEVPAKKPEADKATRRSAAKYKGEPKSAPAPTLAAVPKSSAPVSSNVLTLPPPPKGPVSQQPPASGPILIAPGGGKP